MNYMFDRKNVSMHGPAPSVFDVQKCRMKETIVDTK